jgi:hypothetical protein
MSLSRLFWIGLLALHGPMFLAVLGSLAQEGFELSRVSSALTLALALVFFSLKICDVPFLRIEGRQQSILAYCLIATIAHQGALAKRMERDDALPVTLAVFATTTVAATACPAAWRRRALLRGIGRRLAALYLPRPIPARVTRADVAPALRPIVQARARIDGSRAPPR